jgi:energy-converting hydrogenase A subunit M
MNKAYKFSLGETLRTSALALTEGIFLAYEERENLKRKLSAIKLIKRTVQRILINYRIANDLQLISAKQYGVQVERLVNILAQSKGWEKKTAEALNSK